MLIWGSCYKNNFPFLLFQKKEELIFAENMNGVYVEFNVDPYWCF